VDSRVARFVWNILCLDKAEILYDLEKDFSKIFRKILFNLCLLFIMKKAFKAKRFWKGFYTAEMNRRFLINLCPLGV